ncbi:MAG TPA: substrate-binding domain-containing protein [Desulfitobacteriaceae bacterium]|nr:substrate-binding domain-containing protein [Desulfitobacteriaceae bacterium]
MKANKKLKTGLISLLLAVVMVLGLVGCGTTGGGKDTGFKETSSISVVSREAGSGTRGAFIELTGVQVKNADGTKKDMTTANAIIANKTDVVLTNVAGDTYAIGYISLGSLNDTVKALSVDGVVPSTKSVKDKSYPLQRPFNIATKGTPSNLAQDFIDFIMSKEGQAVVAAGYVSVNDGTSSYQGQKPAGKLTVAGSSSVSPLMEKLIEAYQKVNTAADIELQTSDSTAGMTGAIAGTCDIGMASRDLTDSEKAILTPLSIAMDGICIIVNKTNPITNISREALKKIYTGETTTWGSL